jgi:Tannase and feruloyl esterase
MKNFLRRFWVAAFSCACVQIASLPDAVSASASGAPADLLPGAAPVQSCEALRELALPHTAIEQAAVVPGTAGAPSWCRITAIVSYPATGDRFTVWIGLPVAHWNGRFQGLGGGGYLAGSPDSLAPQVAKGYAAAATDAGLQRAAEKAKPAAMDGSFALDADGRLNWNLIRDFAHRGIHEMTVTGKALTQAFYGRAAPRAYFYGCSTGGRQGQMEAQHYPNDYDGIMSGAPAVNWTKLHMAQMWGELAMLETQNVVASCKLAAATQAAVTACDALDGVKDGIISAPRQCRYDPKSLVGTSAGDCGMITAADAEIIRTIWAGPHRQDGSFLWYGPQRGADLSALNGSDPTAHEGAPFPVTLDWWKYFIRQNPNWDWHTLTRDTYEQLWDQSLEEYTVIASDNPDLSAFRRHGGKTILWHGEADQLIYSQGTIDYFQHLQQRAGGAKAADGFVRLFMAPGVGHCAGGIGPQPTGQLEALVRWVEQGVAPASILAVSTDKQGAVTRSRPLCPYPSVAVYQGAGSTDEAKNFKCAAAPAAGAT